MVYEAISFAAVFELLERFGSSWRSLAQMVSVAAFLIGILKFFCTVWCISLLFLLPKGRGMRVETICKLFCVDFVNWK